MFPDRAQLLTLHPVAEHDGSVQIVVTAMGGEELTQIHAEPSNAVSVLLADINAELGPGTRRFMLPDGRVLQEGAEQALLSAWLSGELREEPQADEDAQAASS